MLKVIKRVGNPEIKESTKHVADRQDRLNEYSKLMNRDFIASFLCDTGHKNGLEIHSINTEGLIYISNQESKKLVTILCARPQQIRRYFEKLNIPLNSVIKNVIKKTIERKNDGLNCV